MLPQLLRVVIASPSDVQAERVCLEKLVEELRQSLAVAAGIQLVLGHWQTDIFPKFHISWLDTPMLNGGPGFATSNLATLPNHNPHTLIEASSNIYDCDLLIGVFWKRFGVMSTHTVPGVEQEFRAVMNHCIQMGQPRAIVFLNQKFYTPLSPAEAEQQQALLEFKNDFSRHQYWWPYKTKPQLEKMVRFHLTQSMFPRQLRQDHSAPTFIQSVEPSSQVDVKPTVPRHNFYSWNTVNPDMCYGRDNLLKDLTDGLISTKKSYGLTGGRRMGKTTVLRRIERDLQLRAKESHSTGRLLIPIYIDGQALPESFMASHIWGYILDEANKVIRDQRLSSPRPCNFLVFKEIANDVLLNQPYSLRIMLLFDELERVLITPWARDFLGHMRALLSNSGDLSTCFTAVFAGAREMDHLQDDLTSPLANILQGRQLKVLAFNDACTLMQEPMGEPRSKEFLDRAYWETGGHPMLLQYIMQQIQESQTQNPELLLEQATQTFIQERRWQLSEWWNKYCTQTARHVYSCLPSDQTLVALEQLVHEFGANELDWALRNLLHVGIIQAENNELAFRYSGEIFRRWYRTNGVVTQASTHDPQIYKRLANIDERLGNKYLSAWGIYQHSLPNYSGAVGEMRDILTLLLDYLAPSEQVASESNFKFEEGQQKPTRRQRVRYIIRQRQSKERTKEVISDFQLLETLCDEIANSVAGAYSASSSLTHTIATRDKAYGALKQWDSILAQLLQSP